MIFTKIFRWDPRADICDVVVQAGAADYVTSENKMHLANSLAQIQAVQRCNDLHK